LLLFAKFLIKTLTLDDDDQGPIPFDAEKVIIVMMMTINFFI
jgi:hypothetical protein